MFNVVLQWYCWLHVISALRRVTATSKSQAQQYQGFFNGPQSVYQQQSMANIDSQKWHYSSNQQPAAYSWYWTSNDRPSASYFKNSLPSNRADQLASWACGRSQITSRFSRIMGGQDAAPHSYPWMVSLAKRSMNNLHLCGGVLVTRRHVITAAHCMEDFDGPNDLNILAGIHFTSEKSHPAPAMAITPHPQYEPETFANDIAVITLVSSLPENDPRISPICLPPDDVPSKSYPPLKVAGVAIGWGSTYFGGNPSVALKQVVLPILETTKWPCNVYVTYAYGQLCAGELRGGVDTCQADSGGPMMIENSDGRWEVVGITSFGQSCGKPNTPGIYTRVGAYNSFIRSTVSLSRYSPHYSSACRLYSCNGWLSSIIPLIIFVSLN